MHALKCAGANLELYRLELGGSTVVNNTLPSTHTWFYYLNKNYSLSWFEHVTASMYNIPLCPS